MAFLNGLNIEHYEIGRPASSRTAVTVALLVDPLNNGWRDYGLRVRFWRTLGLLNEFELPASVLLNADAALKYPEIVTAGSKRDWVFLGHGRKNSRVWVGLDIATERRVLHRIAVDLADATGRAPRGWPGTAPTETENKAALLAGFGFTHSLDWTADDEPSPMTVPSGRFILVPYSIKIKEISGFDDMWLTTTVDIASWYFDHRYD